MRTLLPVSSLAVVVISFATGCPDAPAALNSNPQGAPGNVPTPLVGVTADGVGRARLDSSAQIGNGLAGLRAKISRDQGVTFSERQPVSRYFPDNIVVLDHLRAGDSLQVALVTVSNIGIESTVAEYGAPTLVDIPPTTADNTAPPTVFMNDPRLTPSGAALTWSDPGGDTFGYHVDKSVDGSAFAPVGPSVIIANGTPGFFDADVPGGHSYQWQLTVEDLSGNLSAPSTSTLLGVP